MSVSEHTFGSKTDAAFDYRERCNQLRCRPTAWLRRRDRELEREERRIQIERLAVINVLDERGEMEGPANGVSERTARQTVEMARALESTPLLAAAAHAGDLSSEQLAPVLRIADESSDAAWAQRAPNIAPADLGRIARTQRKPSTEDAAARHEARDLAFWWRRHAGMLDGRFSIPDIDGALVESVFNHMIERMRPAKGERWDTYGHRGADALVELCRTYADVEPTGRCQPHLLVEVPLEGPAHVAGIPLADSTVEALQAQATIEPVLVDDHGAPIAHGTAAPAIPPKIRRAVLLRDAHCRWPGCERTTGLDAHHLTPRSWGGTNDISNIAAACKGGGTDHHRRLIPQGDWALVGNPNLPDGLKLVHRDDSAAPRAGPEP